MKMRITVAISIFVLLFSFAWLLNQKGKREFYVPQLDEEALEIFPIINEIEVEVVRKIKAFKSREYVRVQKIS